MKILKLLDEKFEEYIMVFLIALMTTLIFVQVVSRYVFNNSLAWTEELSRYIFLWVTWLGASYGVKINGHIRLTVLTAKMNKTMQKIVGIIVYIAWFLFMVFLVTKGFELVMKTFNSGTKSIAIHMPMWIPYASVPVGCALMLVRMIQNIKAIIAGTGVSEQEEVEKE